MAERKMKKQEDFWLSLMTKYEQRNIELEQQQCRFQHRLEAMQSSMPAALMYSMTKSGNGKQANMMQFMSQVGAPQGADDDCPCGPCTATRQAPPPKPNLNSDSALNPDSCACSPCMARASTEKESSHGGTPQSPQPQLESCSCTDCSCNPCTDKNKLENQTAAKKNSHVDTPQSHQPQLESCSCTDCSCNPCADKQRLENQTTKISPDTTQIPPPTQPHLESCSCADCACNPCADKQKSEVQAQTAPKKSSGDDAQCPCSSCEDQSPMDSVVPSRAPTPATSQWTRDPSLSQQSSGNMFDNSSMFSLQSADLLYVSKLQELAIKEKQMKHQIQEMEHRERAYMETLRQADEMWACMEGCYKQCLSDVEQHGDSDRQKFEKMNQQLMDENARLADELKNAKLELKQCMERIQGPINRELDKERRRSDQLESDLRFASKNLANKECCYANDINDMKNKLNCTCRDMLELSSTNDQLQREICLLQCKYKELQKDLINQKLSEARTLERLNETLNMSKARNRTVLSTPEFVECECGEDRAEQSTTTQECEECECGEDYD